MGGLGLALGRLMQVVDCRKEYARRGLPTVFKVLSFAESTDLDELFAADAYLRAAETSVQVCAQNDIAESGVCESAVWDHPDPA